MGPICGEMGVLHTASATRACGDVNQSGKDVVLLLLWSEEIQNDAIVASSKMSPSWDAASRSIWEPQLAVAGGDAEVMSPYSLYSSMPGYS